MAKVDATRSYGAEVVLTGAGSRTRSRLRRRTSRSTARRSCIPFEDPRRDRGPGDDRPRARRAGAGGRDRRSSRSAAAGSPSGIALALRAVKPGRAHRRRAGGGHAARRPGLHDRRRHRREAARRAHDRASSTSVLDDMVAVTDEEISEAIVLLLERTKLVVEGAGAVGVAALLRGKIDGSGAVVPLLSGGNIDATLLISRDAPRPRASPAATSCCARACPTVPGELAKLLDAPREERVNVVEVEHQRESAGLPVGETGVELTLLTRDAAHCDEIVATLDGARLSDRAAQLAAAAAEGRQLAAARAPTSRCRRRAQVARRARPRAARSLRSPRGRRSRRS